MPSRRGHKGGKPPFRSKAQWRLRWAFATKQVFAHKWAHKTPGGPKVRYDRLPPRKGVRHKVR